MENDRGQGRVISLRGTRYKYNFWFLGGREEMYDLESDPCEIHNLLAHGLAPGQQGIYEEMKKRLTAYEVRFGHPDSVCDGQLVPFQGEIRPEWPPCKAGLDWQMPFHLFNQLPNDPTRYQPDSVEVIEATRKEPVLKLSGLDIFTSVRAATRNWCA